MKISHRIVASLALMVTLVVAICVFTLFVTERMDQIIHVIIQRELPGIRLVDNVMSITTAISIDEQRYLFFGEQKSLVQHREDTARLRMVLNELRQVRRKAALEPEVLRLLQLGQKYLDQQEEVIMLYRDGETELARHYSSYEVASVREEVMQACSRLLTTYRRELFEREGEYLILAAQLKQAALAFALLSIFTAALLAFYGIRSLVLPLSRLMEITQAIRRGDLSRRARETSNDEMGELAVSMNKMLGDLQSNIDAVNQARTALSETNDELLSRTEQFFRELRFARQVQKSIVPRGIHMEGVKIFARIQAAREVGGDFYDLFNVPRDAGQPLLGVVIGDVMGKGVPAALLMVLSLTILREVSRSTPAPGELFTRANARIREQILDDEMPSGVSAAALLIDTESREMRFAKAGHEDVLWWRAADCRLESLSASGLFLGIFADEQYEEKTVSLAPRDKIMLYTDGITEARNKAGEMFGIERTLAMLRQRGNSEVDVLGEHILDRIADWQSETELSDDIGLVIIEIA